MAREKPHERRAGFEVKALSNEIHRVFSRRNKGDETTGMQNAIIHMLEHAEAEGRDVFQRDVEQRFNIRGATASGMLKLMVQKGYITREPLPSDARCKRLVLTEAGRLQGRRARESIDRIEACLMQDIPAAELEIFFRVIEKMRYNLETQGENLDV